MVPRALSRRSLLIGAFTFLVLLSLFRFSISFTPTEWVPTRDASVGEHHHHDMHDGGEGEVHILPHIPVENHQDDRPIEVKKPVGSSKESPANPPATEQAPKPRIARLVPSKSPTTIANITRHPTLHREAVGHLYAGGVPKLKEGESEVLVAGTHGFHVFDRLYLKNGVFYVVSDEKHWRPREEIMLETMVKVNGKEVDISPDVRLEFLCE